MPAGRVAEASMQSSTPTFAWLRAHFVLRARSVFSYEKTLFIVALFQTLPGKFTEQLTP